MIIIQNDCFDACFVEGLMKQVLNPKKGVSGTHSFELMHIYIAPMVNSWRSEVGSVDRLQNSTLGSVVALQY